MSVFPLHSHPLYLLLLLLLSPLSPPSPSPSHRRKSIKSLCGERTSPARPDEFRLSAMRSFLSPGRRIMTARPLAKRKNFPPSKGSRVAARRRGELRQRGKIVSEMHPTVPRVHPHTFNSSLRTYTRTIRVRDASFVKTRRRSGERRYLRAFQGAIGSAITKSV